VNAETEGQVSPSTPVFDQAFVCAVDGLFVAVALAINRMQRLDVFRGRVVDHDHIYMGSRTSGCLEISQRHVETPSIRLIVELPKYAGWG